MDKGGDYYFHFTDEGSKTQKGWKLAQNLVELGLGPIAIDSRGLCSVAFIPSSLALLNVPPFPN